MENSRPTANDPKGQALEGMLRRRVRYFKWADGWFNRFVRLGAFVHEGFWLGCLSVDELNAVTADHFDNSRESASTEQSLRGLLDWETFAVNRHFGPGSRILVAAAGAGREVLALRRWVTGLKVSSAIRCWSRRGLPSLSRSAKHTG